MLIIHAYQLLLFKMLDSSFPNFNTGSENNLGKISNIPESPFIYKNKIMLYSLPLKKNRKNYV